MHNGYALTSAGNRRMYSCSVVSSGVKSVHAEQKPGINLLMFSNAVCPAMMIHIHQLLGRHSHEEQKTNNNLSLFDFSLVSAWKTVARHVTDVLLPIISLLEYSHLMVTAHLSWMFAPGLCFSGCRAS